MHWIAATKNAGKLAELQALFGRAGHTVEAWDGYRDVEETADSYAGNAWLKVRALRAQLEAAGLRVAVVADDSGIEVAALGGRPGIYSARYAGEGATWPQRRARLLGEARGAADRRARFVCVVAAIDEAGRELAREGIVEGELCDPERGELGFSYDPLFWYPPANATFAELTADEKNRVSHRAQAVAAVLEAMRDGGTTRPY